MKILKIFAVFILMMQGSSAKAATPIRTVVVKELRPEWMIFRSSAYEPFNHQNVSTIYFTVSSVRYPGDFICLRSPKPYNVFINNKLVAQRQYGSLRLSLDSLAEKFSPTVSVAVFQNEGVELLTTVIEAPVSENASAGLEILPRKSNFFRDFSIIAFLILSVCFVLLFRSNPKLTLDYLNVYKVITLQEREENLLATRITASANLLFYLFCSAACALSLLTVFYNAPEQSWAAYYFPLHSTAQAFLQWSKLIVIVASLLTLKLLIIFLFSTIFRLRDTASLQFYNFIRILFLITAVILVVNLLYFIYYGYPVGPHIGLLRTTVIIMAFSMVMIFFKLLSFAPFSFFHLFSYLCASEIIPLVILLKVLLY